MQFVSSADQQLCARCSCSGAQIADISMPKGNREACPPLPDCQSTVLRMNAPERSRLPTEQRSMRPLVCRYAKRMAAADYSTEVRSLLSRLCGLPRLATKGLCTVRHL